MTRLMRLQGPRCSIRSKNIYSDANPDYLKMTLLNLPAAILVRGSIFFALASSPVAGVDMYQQGLPCMRLEHVPPCTLILC